MSEVFDEPHAPARYQPPSPVIAPGVTLTDVSRKITSIPLTKPEDTPKGWIAGFLMAGGIMSLLLLAVTWLLVRGVGVWGVNIPVGWGFAIINFVWWIGIGHAGTLISAILLLFRQQWRMSISRFAEAMTIFAVACAGIFPLIHTGRPWYAAYFLLPYPNTLRLWPQFRSPLVWDVFAVSTYATASVLFWFMGMIPDLAVMRDRAKNRFVRIAYGMLAMGWRGSSMHWHRMEMAYLLLAGLCTPLVLSVHTVVSFDFATGVVPGWHATIFPPYFVAGAIYAGFAMVLTLAIPVRYAYNLYEYITDRHMQNMAKVMLVSGLIVAYGYACELFFAFYSGNHYEKFMMTNRVFGPYWYAYWCLILCNIAVPQLLWIKSVRSNVYALFIISMFISVGMWIERFVIVVVSLHRDFLPSAWGMYHPTRWDIMTYVGTIGLFLTLFMLFLRFLPALSIFEIQTLIPSEKAKEQHHA